MTVLWTDRDGPGSFDEMVECVERVLRENFLTIPEQDMTVPPNNQYKLRARSIVMSLLSRQNILIRSKD